MDTPTRHFKVLNSLNHQQQLAPDESKEFFQGLINRWNEAVKKGEDLAIVAKQIEFDRLGFLRST